MIDAHAFAQLLCDWCLEPAPGQQVLIAATTLAEPLVRELHAMLLERGAWPILRLVFPELATSFYDHATDQQLDAFAPLELVEAQSVDVSLTIDAPADPHALSRIDPERIIRAQRARQPIQQARLAKRWCATQWPTAGLAAQAGMAAGDYATFLGRALFLDRADAPAAWRELSARQAELVEQLEAAREVRIEAPGTDLRLRVEGRRWINSDGRRNMPSGEVFTGPVEDSPEGTILFTVPSSVRGVRVAGVQLTFRGGEVVAASAREGDAYLQAALRTDAGARRVGELGIGTNRGIDRPTGSILLDEKMAGTVHLALGRSYEETGGVNTSALHWDLICDLRDGGRLTVDGEPLDLFSDR